MSPAPVKAHGRSRPAGGAHPAEPAATSRLLPTGRDFFSPTGPFLVPLLLLLATRLVIWMLLPLAAEDAFITFRYARNLAAGNGLVYNPGERVMGFTSMPWTLWNALGFLTVKNPILWSRLSTLVADLIVLVFAGNLLLRHAGRAAAFAFTFFFAVWPYFPAVSASGMESTGFAALIVLAAALAESRHPVTGGVLAALAWIRPEGLAAALVVSLYATWRDRIVAVVLLAAALAGTWAYFGTIVPQSLVTKAQVYGTAGPWAGRHWWEWLSPVPIGRWPQVGDTNFFILLTVVVAPALAIGLRELWRMRRTGLAAANKTTASALAVWLGYAALGVAYFWWYLAVPLVGIIMTAAVGLPRLTRGPALYVSLALATAGVWTVTHNLYIGRSQNEASFARVASFLVGNAQPGQAVFLEPIGVIGFSAPLRVIDEVGLVSPRVAERRLGGPGWYTDIVEAEQPEWIVVRYGTVRTGTGFAGIGQLFRTEEEWRAVFARYQRVYPAEGEPGDQDLVVMKRL